ncbi:molybdopterin biosynthesis [Stylonychia lemnae]|uniref:Molybdopterin biosynthesis n=1 Tax=Stylonychia lemnae TaxID=5949 RepID=A0A077ZMZ1_STYLE|nr:molybdopterin biosynthesis [Stylonychia lemnae]|eukprot:CDW71322.1 molybdopterin biosynthesis [Stylonychia lemnae]
MFVRKELFKELYRKLFRVYFICLILLDISAGMVLADDVYAIDNLPPFRASVMDGYAVRSTEAKIGQTLSIVKGKKGLAGEKSQILEQDYDVLQCLYVTTGGPVPNAFDSVLPIEETELSEDKLSIKVLKQMNVNQFIREKGSDVKQGEKVLEQGSVLRSAEIGLLATVGKISEIKVYKKPIIGLLSTGNELVEANTVELLDGYIRDSNKIMLKAMISEHNIASEVRDYGIVGDNGILLDEELQRASNECDILVTSGGVSMGELDLVKPYIELKGEVIFGRLNMKPGKPTTFGILNKSIILALPGNPVSSFVTSHLFLIRAAKYLSGQFDTYQNHLIKVQLIPRNVKLDKERPEYHRAVAVQDQLSGKIYAFSTGSQLSSRLISARNANCLVILPKAPQSNDNYQCFGDTQALVIGQIVTKTSNEIAELVKQHDGQTLKNQCCGGHHGHNHNHQDQQNQVSSLNSQKVENITQQQQIQTNQSADFKVGIITISDRASSGEYPTGDLSGQAMRQCCESFPHYYNIIQQTIVSDDKEKIKGELLRMSDELKCNLVLTSGGTGFFERDITPEATLEVIERRAESLANYILIESMKIVPTACLSRAVIGTRGKTMIINLPGKPKAVKENFEILMRSNVLIHALGQLKGTDKH